ncbi:Electron transport complex protein RnfB (fragment) [uncultured Eubacteriales bacterium]|uniref:Electron transport complex protein RnfB n=1 Tax=uncultured Eubacteriales bacterium TaxID=172733 RepID=A0A212KH08_9FIRM
MNPILMAVLLVAVIAMICAVMLVVAANLMAVKADDKFAPLREALPGANCGACGYPGCDGYAKALASGDEKDTALCKPGRAACAEKLAAILAE